MIEAIIREIGERKHYLKGEVVNTIYFGGGTPSAIDFIKLKSILETIYREFTIADQPEITVEANPDDLHPTYFKNLKSIGVNRLSIGVQSFIERDLKWMNRRHSAEKSVDSVKFAYDHGFNNINIDLIYGVPGLSNDEWKFNLDKFFELEIPHLSAYHLTIEPKTVFGVQKKKGKLTEIDEDTSVDQFEILLEETSKRGYQHYEISNFAREGYYSKHNLGYWKNNLYLGVGPSAHSFDGISRRWNTKIHRDYIQKSGLGEGYFEEEILSKEEQFNDYILTNLRTMWGINLKNIKELFGDNFAFETSSTTEKYRNYLDFEHETIKLNNKGKFIADRIASEFFIVANE
jgi:oxygen-independent coproporphyrinogen-3 oxidase